MNALPFKHFTKEKLEKLQERIVAYSYGEKGTLYHVHKDDYERLLETARRVAELIEAKLKDSGRGCGRSLQFNLAENRLLGDEQ